MLFRSLTGGRQRGLGFEAADSGIAVNPAAVARGPARPARPFQPTPEETAAFEAFIAGFKTPSLWKN